MKMMNVYLVFDGNGGEAMRYYKQCFGGELFEMKFSDAPGGDGSKIPPEAKDRLMHGALKQGNTLQLMASDTMPGMPFHKGDNFNVAVDCESSEEVDKYLKFLSQGGEVSWKAEETFWAHRFGACTDKYGIKWMFTHSKPMQ